MKPVFLLYVSLFLLSCEKNYVCVCTSAKTSQDTIVDHIKTTKLGSKGYKKTCSKKENNDRSNCRIR